MIVNDVHRCRLKIIDPSSIASPFSTPYQPTLANLKHHRRFDAFNANVHAQSRSNSHRSILLYDSVESRLIADSNISPDVALPAC